MTGPRLSVSGCDSRAAEAIFLRALGILVNNVTVSNNVAINGQHVGNAVTLFRLTQASQHRQTLRQELSIWLLSCCDTCPSPTPDFSAVRPPHTYSLSSRSLTSSAPAPPSTPPRRAPILPRRNCAFPRTPLVSLSLSPLKVKSAAERKSKLPLPPLNPELQCVIGAASAALAS